MPGIEPSHPYHNRLSGQTQTSPDELGVMVRRESLHVCGAWQDSELALVDIPLAAHVLLEAGRYREALEEYRRAAHVSKFGPQQWVLWGEIGLLLMFDEVAEARSEARRLKGSYVDAVELSIAGTAGKWEQADSIAGTSA